MTNLNKRQTDNCRVMTSEITYLILFTSLFLFASCKGQSKNNGQVGTLISTQMDNYELTPETAHPNARKLMEDEFYWSPIEESGPFGSDDGSDAFYGFRQWRENNKAISPTVYLNELIEDWCYPRFDLNEMNEDSLKKYISSSEISAMTLTGQDNAIIAVGFGQFVLEGKIDEDIKVLTNIALQRELLPSVIGMWDGDYKKTRFEQLTKMLETLDKMNKL